VCLRVRVSILHVCTRDDWSAFVSYSGGSGPTKGRFVERSLDDVVDGIYGKMRTGLALGVSHMIHFGAKHK
jgi:hypothetical protein